MTAAAALWWAGLALTFAGGASLRDNFFLAAGLAAAGTLLFIAAGT